MKDRDLQDRIAGAARPGGKDLLELISAEAERLAAAEEGPGRLLQALLDTGLGELAPTAAERHHHAFEQRLKEASAKELARLAPIYPESRGTLAAAPIGDLRAEGMDLFVERVLAAVLERRPSKVRLILAGLGSRADAADAIADLEDDLAQQGVRLVTEG